MAVSNLSARCFGQLTHIPNVYCFANICPVTATAVNLALPARARSEFRASASNSNILGETGDGARFINLGAVAQRSGSGGCVSVVKGTALPSQMQGLGKRAVTEISQSHNEKLRGAQHICGLWVPVNVEINGWKDVLYLCIALTPVVDTS